MPCRSAPGNFPFRGAKPLTLGQEAVSISFGVLTLQLKFKVFGGKDTRISW